MNREWTRMDANENRSDFDFGLSHEGSPNGRFLPEGMVHRPYALQFPDFPPTLILPKGARRPGAWGAGVAVVSTGASFLLPRSTLWKSKTPLRVSWVGARRAFRVNGNARGRSSLRSPRCARVWVRRSLTPPPAGLAFWQPPSWGKTPSSPDCPANDGTATRSSQQPPGRREPRA